MKTLAYDTIVANARFFGGDLSKVPHMALTVGVGTVMVGGKLKDEEAHENVCCCELTEIFFQSMKDAREVVLLVTGPHKVSFLELLSDGGKGGSNTAITQLIFPTSQPL